MSKETQPGKVSIGSGKKMSAKSQPITGKLSGFNQGSSTQGSAVQPAKSNPIQGKGKSSGTAMGNGSVINSIIKV